LSDTFPVQNGKRKRCSAAILLTSLQHMSLGEPKKLGVTGIEWNTLDTGLC